MPAPISLGAIELSAEDVDRIIGMAWEDRTPFDAIRQQFGLSEQQVRNLMKAHLRPGSYRTWRIRMEKTVSTKHTARRSFSAGRFKSRNQKLFR